MVLHEPYLWPKVQSSGEYGSLENVFAYSSGCGSTEVDVANGPPQHALAAARGTGGVVPGIGIGERVGFEPTIRFPEHPSDSLFTPPRRYWHHQLSVQLLTSRTGSPRFRTKVSNQQFRISKSCRWRTKGRRKRGRRLSTEVLPCGD